MGTKKFLLHALMLAACMSDIDNSVYGINSSRTTLVKCSIKPIKLSHRELRIYIIKGEKIEAYSKKDAIKRYNHKHK